MKIRIKADGHNIRLWLPTSLLKSRVGYQILSHGVGKISNGVRKSANNDDNTESQSQDYLPQKPKQSDTPPFTRKQQLEIYAALKHAIKTHGHFNLVEIESADGEKVLIRV